MLRKSRDEGERRETESEKEEVSPSSKTEADPSDFARRTVSYVGPSVHFDGELKADEGLIIEGIVDGRVEHEGDKMTVGKQGRVNGTVYARVVEVRGLIDGDVHAEELVRLYSSAVITGTVHCGRIVMDDGATFNGNMRMNGETEEPEICDQTDDDTIANIEKPKIVKAAS